MMDGAGLRGAKRYVPEDSGLEPSLMTWHASQGKAAYSRLSPFDNVSMIVLWVVWGDASVVLRGKA